MTEIIQTLKAATNGLAQSFDIFYHVDPTHDGLTLTEFLTWTGHSLETPVEVLELPEFFSLLSDLTFSDATTKEQVIQSFNSLRAVLEQELTSLHVFRMGPDKSETYIIGKEQEGNFAGLKTTLLT